MQKWRQVSWKRVAVALAAIFAAMWLTGKAIEWLAPCTEARSMLRDNPALAQVPTPLPDHSLATLSNNPIVFFGLTVHTPWGKIGTIRGASRMAMIPFPDRHVGMILYEPSQNDFEQAMWKTAQADSLKTRISNYNLMAAEMAVTPDQVKWWKPPAQNEARSSLLAMKSLRLGDMKAIYSVNFGGWRGFQEGNPAVPPYRVRLDLYDLADYHYEIVVSANGGSGSAFSQPEVNAIVASLKPVMHN